MFPSPPDRTVDTLKALHDPDVDEWVVDLSRLKDKLEECNS